MAQIPSKQLHRSGTLEDLQANLSNREIGFCTTDRLAYYKLNGILFPMGSGIIPDPTENALFMAYEDPEHPGEYIYAWKSLESIEPIPNNPLKLWSRLAGMGLYAEVARNDERGRNIAQMLDVVGIGLCIYGETPYSDIVAMLDTYNYIYVLVDTVGDGLDTVIYLPLSEYDSDSITFSTVVWGTHFFTVSVSEDGGWSEDLSVIRPSMTDEEFEDVLAIFAEESVTP